MRRMWVFCLSSFKFSHYYLHLKSKYNHYSSFYYRTQVVPCDTRLCAIQAAVNPSFSTDQDETKELGKTCLHTLYLYSWSKKRL